VARYRQLLACRSGADAAARAAIDRLTARGEPAADGTAARGNGGALVPAWRVRLAGRNEWALLPDTVSPDTDVLFVAGPNRLGARAVPDGRRLWDRDLGFTPGWVAQLADSVVAAGPG